jgi:hypothetical protein
MAKLRLQPQGRKLLAKWLESDRPKEGDPERVIEVLHSVISGTWADRWYIEKHQTGDERLMPIHTIWASKTLAVRIRLWPAEDPPELELINIFDLSELPEVELPEDF